MSLITRNAKEYRSMTAQLMSQNPPIVITSSTKSKFWHFHVVVAQRRAIAKKCTKKRDAHAKLLFCLSNLLLFCRSCCCRRRFCFCISVKQEGERGKERRICTFSSFSFPSRPLHNFPCYLGVAQIE